MKFLIWEIRVNDYALAKIQWALYKTVGAKPKDPCGHSKTQAGYWCRQPLDLKHCYVEKDHDGCGYVVKCKCCNSVKMSSNHYIDPTDDSAWSGW